MPLAAQQIFLVRFGASESDLSSQSLNSSAPRDRIRNNLRRFEVDLKLRANRRYS